MLFENMEHADDTVVHFGNKEMLMRGVVRLLQSPMGGSGNILSWPNQNPSTSSLPSDKMMTGPQIKYFDYVASMQLIPRSAFFSENFWEFSLLRQLRSSASCRNQHICFQTALLQCERITANVGNIDAIPKADSAFIHSYDFVNGSCSGSNLLRVTA